MGEKRLRLLGKLAFAATVMVGLPLLGVYFSGKELGPYLEFPPATRYVKHAPFSGWAFFGLTAIIIATIGPLAMRAWQCRPSIRRLSAVRAQSPMSWWGWLALVVLLVAWMLAWSRFNWLQSLQAHTFTPLWVAYIVVINAFCQKHTGSCLMLAKPLNFVLLFPISAIFWWFFEYLNRFVQNWYYTGPDFSPWSYFWFATLPFSTVLPAVLSTSYWLERSIWIQKAFTGLPSVSLGAHKAFATIALIVAGAGLAFIGVWPNFLYPLLWLSPLMIIASLQTFARQSNIFTEIAAGDWQRAIAGAAAALICGFFWEMWNLHSLAKWKYSIPLVQHYQIFEMPILGFAGYLPFGLECIVIGDLLKEAIQRFKSESP